MHMSLAPITLTTDKSTAVINNAHRKLRQDESGLSITVTVLNEDNTAYDLTGKNLVFCENKQNNKIIIDDGKGDNSGKFNRNSDNDTKGVFTYVLQQDVYAASGKAWFEITDGTIVDSTKNFYFDVEKDASVSISNNDYIGSLKALETAMAGAQNKVTSDLADMEAQITEQIADTKTANEEEITQAVKNLTDQTTAALSSVNEYTQKLATLQSQWDSELQSIQTKANADTDSAVKAINDRYTNDFAKLQSDFANWQTSTTQNYQKQVDGILAQVQQNGTEVANVQKQVDDTVAKMQALTQQFSNIDFTQFLKPSALDNYYTKTEVNNVVADLNAKIATAGTVKTVDNIQPDSNGNIQTDHYTKSQTDQKLGQKITFVKCDSPQAAHDASMNPAADGSIVFGIYDMNDEPSQAAVVGDQKINIEWLYNHLNDLSTQVSGLSSLQSLINGKADSATVYTKTQVDQMIANAGKVKTVNSTQPDSNGNISISIPDISGKADKTDVNNLQAMVTGLSTKVDSVVTKLSDGTLAKVAHFKVSEEQKAVDWSKDDGKGGLPKIGIIDG